MDTAAIASQSHKSQALLIAHNMIEMVNNLNPANQVDINLYRKLFSPTAEIETTR